MLYRKWKDMALYNRQIGEVISRDEAWALLPPYGKRVIDTLDGTLDPENITSDEAMQIALGADEATQNMLHNLTGRNGHSTDWLQDIGTTMLSKEHGSLRQVLAWTNGRQLANALDERDRALESGPWIVAMIGTAVGKLAACHVLSTEHAEQVQEWLTTPDGLPAMQYTPMSRLEFLRYGQALGTDVSVTGPSAATDYSEGITLQAVDLSDGGEGIQRDIELHEWIHGCLTGLDLLLSTDEAGDAVILPQAYGFADSPANDPDAVSQQSGRRITEGFTDFLKRRLKRAEPALGPRYGRGRDYDEADAWEMIYTGSPAVYAAMLNTCLTDVTPEEPDIKSQMITASKELADTVLGEPGSLASMFSADGLRKLRGR
jgi:hypothetical protein